MNIFTGITIKTSKRKKASKIKRTKNKATRMIKNTNNNNKYSNAFTRSITCMTAVNTTRNLVSRKKTKSIIRKMRRRKSIIMEERNNKRGKMNCNWMSIRHLKEFRTLLHRNQNQMNTILSPPHLEGGKTKWVFLIIATFYLIRSVNQVKFM